MYVFQNRNQLEDMHYFTFLQISLKPGLIEKLNSHICFHIQSFVIAHVM